MTNKSPIDPQSSSDDDFGFDDFIGILVAFITIGTILFWSLSRKDSNWNFGNLLSKVSTKASVQSKEDNNLTKLLVPSPEPNNTLKSGQATTESKATQEKSILLEKEELDAVILPPLVAGIQKKLPPDFDKVTLPETSGETSENKAETNTSDVKPQATNTPVAVSKNTSVEPTPTETQTPTATQSPTPTQTPTPEAKATKLPTIPPPIAFTDIPRDFWAKRFVDKLSSRKIISGYEDFTYRPQQPVNRAEFASIVGKAFQTDISNTKKDFGDIPEKFWAEKDIEKAVSTGFMSGYTDGSFKPEQKIPRVQVIVSLVSGLKLKTPASPEKILSDNFKDADQIPEWAREQVATAYVNNLVVNHPDPNSFNPNKEATRAEVATMVHQALVRMGKFDSIESEYLVGQ